MGIGSKIVGLLLGMKLKKVDYKVLWRRLFCTREVFIFCLSNDNGKILVFHAATLKTKVILINVV